MLERPYSMWWFRHSAVRRLRRRRADIATAKNPAFHRSRMDGSVAAVPPNSFRVLVFVCSTVLTASFAAWFARSDFDLRRPNHDHVSKEQPASDPALSPAARFENIASGACLSKEATDSILATTEEPVLIALLEKLPQGFWEAHPNANVLGRALGRKWGSTAPSSSWLPRMNAILDSIKVNTYADKRLFLQMMTGALETAKPAPAELEPLLRESSPAKARLVVEAHAATSPYPSPQDALNGLLKLWQSGRNETTQSERRFLSSVALRYHVSKLKSAEELIQYIGLAAGGAGYDATLLEEVASFHPAIYESYLMALGKKDPNKLAEMARQMMIPADKLKKV